MSISLEKAFNEILSDKFNKVNIAVFTFITAVLGSVQLIFQQQLQNRSNAPEYFQAVLICLIASLCGAVISAGYGALAANRGASGSSDVFPPVSELGSIIQTGIKSFLGCLILAVMIVVPFFIVIAFSAGFFTALSGASRVLGVILLFCLASAGFIVWLFFCLIKFFIPLYLMFADTLNFSAFFAFNKIKDFLDARKGFYFKYIINAVFIPICFAIAFSIVMFIISIFFAAAAGPDALKAGAPAAAIMQFIVYLLSVIFQVFISLLIISLNAQFISIGRVNQTAEEN